MQPIKHIWWQGCVLDISLILWFLCATTEVHSYRLNSVCLLCLCLRHLHKVQHQARELVLKGTDQCGHRAQEAWAAWEDAGGWTTQLARENLELYRAAGMGQGAGTWELRKRQLQALRTNDTPAALEGCSWLATALWSHCGWHDTSSTIAEMPAVGWGSNSPLILLNPLGKFPCCQHCAPLNVVLISLMTPSWLQLVFGRRRERRPLTHRTQRLFSFSGEN